MKRLHILSILVLPFATPAFADTFGTGANTFTIDFVTIGNPGNAADNTTRGAVGYEYQIGKYEISAGMIAAYQANAPSTNLTTTNQADADKPATGISWNEAARFVNWLNEDAGFSAAYKFTTNGKDDDIELWAPGDTGYNPDNLFRNSTAKYFLPTEDEWYKAAYYDPNKAGGAGFWDFATGSDHPQPPTSVAGGTDPGTAVYNQSGPADITNAGGLSFYGTMAQGGNAREWAESAADGVNNDPTKNRVSLGGNSSSDSNSIRNDSRDAGIERNNEFNFGLILGFRVAAVAIPEPSAFMLSLLGMMGVVLKRRR